MRQLRYDLVDLAYQLYVRLSLIYKCSGACAEFPTLSEG